MDLLARQSGKPAFGLESRTFQRLPMHPHILELLGPFTLGHVVQREPAQEPHFAGRCAAAQAQAGRDLLHAHFDAASQWHATEAPAQRGQKIVFTNTCIRFDEFVRNSLVPPLRWLGEFQEVWQVQPDTALEYVLVENDLALENHWFINPDLLPMPLAAALHKQLMEALRALGRDPGLWSAACVFSALGQTLQRELP
jgi:pyochelin synthetase